MITVRSKALRESIQVSREIGRISGRAEGPTLICTGGIHGNEPSGVFALQRLLDDLRNVSGEFRGNFYALSGNMAALESARRFIKRDLNRMWRSAEMPPGNGFSQQGNGHSHEYEEQRELYHCIQQIMQRHSGPYIFIDLHTTSAPSAPFITINDALANRRFATQFPLPVILGIEEYLDGPMLNYINELGHIALGFEAGQHDDLLSIEHHAAFLRLAMVYSGCLSADAMPGFDAAQAMLQSASPDAGRFFEIRYRHAVAEHQRFAMMPGFVNFQPVERQQAVAADHRGEISAPESGRMFMPLYQKQGEDGFFILREVPAFWLKVSALLRALHLDTLLLVLPGVRKLDRKPVTLVVNRRVARWFALEFFHLLGYRLVGREEQHLRFTKRD